MNWLASFWYNHGTKIWGYFVMAVGVAGDILVYAQALDPKHAAIYSLLVAAGTGIVKRGHTNSARLASLPPPQPGTVSTSDVPVVKLLLLFTLLGLAASVSIAVADPVEVPVERNRPIVEAHPLTSVVVTQCSLIVAVYMTLTDGRLLRFDKASNVPSDTLMQMAYAAERSERVEVSCNDIGAVGYERHDPI